MMEKRLRAQYTALDKQMASLNSLSNYVTQQITRAEQQQQQQLRPLRVEARPGCLGRLAAAASRQHASPGPRGAGNGPESRAYPVPSDAGTELKSPGGGPIFKAARNPTRHPCSRLLPFTRPTPAPAPTARWAW